MVRIMFDVSRLVARYAQLEGQTPAVESVLDALLELRLAILDLEDPRFDNSNTQGLRFHFGVVDLAGSTRRPEGLELIDRERGVAALFGLPFKVYRPRMNGQPGPNKTSVAGAEEAALIEQLPLFSRDDGIYSLTNMLLRVDVDIDGEPLSLRWEEWEGKNLIWSAQIFRVDTTHGPVVVVGSDDLPPPEDASRDSVGLDEDVVEDEPDGDGPE